MVVQFIAIIDEAFPANEAPDALQQKASRHDAYARSRRAAFIGRQQQLSWLDTHFEQNGEPVVDTTVRVWNAESGAELAVLRGHDGAVQSVCYSPNGRCIASGSARGRPSLPTDGRFESFIRQVLSASRAGTDNLVRLWDAETGADLVVLRGHEDKVFSVSYSPDGRQTATASSDGTVRLWDAGSGAELAAFCGGEGSRSTPNDVAFSPDGSRIVSQWADMGRDRIVQVWDAESCVCLEVIQGLGDTAAIAAGVEEGLPWRALVRDQETVVEDAAKGKVLARLPNTFEHFTTNCSGDLWAGAAADHLYIITLEGAKETCGDTP